MVWLVWHTVASTPPSHVHISPISPTCIHFVCYPGACRLQLYPDIQAISPIPVASGPAAPSPTQPTETTILPYPLCRSPFNGPPRHRDKPVLLLLCAARSAWLAAASCHLCSAGADMQRSCSAPALQDGRVLLRP